MSVENVKHESHKAFTHRTDGNLGVINWIFSQIAKGCLSFVKYSKFIKRDCVLFSRPGCFTKNKKDKRILN